MTVLASEKPSQESNHGRKTRKFIDPFPLDRAWHAQAKLKWARAARDSKLARMAAEEAELDELRKAIVAKSILIKMLKTERSAAQKKVAAGRVALREAVLEVDYQGDYQVQQKDSLYMDGLSSDFERLVSTSPSKSIAGRGSPRPSYDDVDNREEDHPLQAQKDDIFR